MKRVFKIAGGCVIAVIIAIGIYLSLPEDTVDYSGVVKSVEYSAEDNCTYIDTYMIFDESSSVIIKVKPKTPIKYITGEKMTVSDIAKGDLIDLDYKGKIDGYGSTVTAKWIKVAPKYSVSEVK